MKNLVLVGITVLLTAILIYAIIWGLGLSSVALIILISFIVICSSMWAIHEIRFRRWYKGRQRFNWYNKMGLLESGYIKEPEHAMKYLVKGSLI